MSSARACNSASLFGGWWAVHHDYDLVTTEGFVLQHATEAGAISWLGALTVEKADVLVVA
jgi:hypothetical protein